MKLVDFKRYSLRKRTVRNGLKMFVFYEVCQPWLRDKMKVQLWLSIAFATIFRTASCHWHILHHVHLSYSSSFNLSLFIYPSLSLSLSLYLSLPSIYLSICLFICLSICLSIFIQLPIYLSIYLSFYLSIIHLSIRLRLLSVCLSIFLSIHLSVCPSICLPFCRSVLVSIFQYIHIGNFLIQQLFEVKAYNGSRSWIRVFAHFFHAGRNDIKKYLLSHSWEEKQQIN